jgi:hypothetical protein
MLSHETMLLKYFVQWMSTLTPDRTLRSTTLIIITKPAPVIRLKISSCTCTFHRSFFPDPLPYGIHYHKLASTTPLWISSNLFAVANDDPHLNKHDIVMSYLRQGPWLSFACCPMANAVCHAILHPPHSIYTPFNVYLPCLQCVSYGKFVGYA